MAEEITLIIMAAGFGTRFGERIKQLEPVGPGGELLIEYSVYDAIKAGFNHIIFVIRRDILHLFEEKIGDKFSDKVKISYAFQQKEDVITSDRQLIEMRKKPWGTGQAVISAKGMFNGPFAVINADDFYGAESYIAMYDFLKNIDNADKAVPEYAMCGFSIKNTLSENGAVTRGVCLVSDGYLRSLEETRQIRRNNGVISGSYNGEGRIVPENAAVSMNMWGFTYDFIETLCRLFGEYIENLSYETVNDGEFLVPIEVDKLIRDGKCIVKVIPTGSKWFGLTYEADAEGVRNSLSGYVKNGVYPKKLW